MGARPDAFDQLALAPVRLSQRTRQPDLHRVGNELLKGLDLKDRTLTSDAVNQALQSRPIASALAGWKALTGTDDPSGNRLDRLLVYATIERGSFTLADILGILEELGENVSPDRVERSLERLELAFVLKKNDTRYTYAVPIFKQMVLAQEPRFLLTQELKSTS